MESSIEQDGEARAYPQSYTKLWFSKARRAQNNQDYETWVEGGVVPTLNAFDNGDIRATTVIVLRRREGKPGGGKGPLLSNDRSLSLGGVNDQSVFILEQEESIVRRLTPIECERLQGFPDNWTDSQPLTQRYKQMGNAVTVPVAKWIFERIADTIDLQ